MIQCVIEKLIISKEKGLKVDFKTNGKKYFIYIANSLYVTINEKEFKNIYSKWNIVKSF